MKTLRVNHFIWFFLSLLASPACGQNRYEPQSQAYNRLVDTESRAIEFQQKKHYRFPARNLTVDNMFDGARLNGAVLQGNTLKLAIEPENEPINGSPWYAFRIISSKRQSITVELNYRSAFHRYHPRWSEDGKNWFSVDRKKIRSDRRKDRVWFTINVPVGTLWIAAQEIVTSNDVYAWGRQLESPSFVRYSVIGQSALGRDIPCLDIYSGDKTSKPIIAIFGRQHPPEVTGHFALQAFIERLLKHENADEFFKRYRLLVFPLINPDGVDLGHWRHNAQGVDLNRDYAEYQQPEIKAITNFLVSAADRNRAHVLIGLDFHSTYHDVYYTNQETEGVALAAFKDDWLNAIRQGLRSDNYKFKEEKHSVSSNPSAQHWFYHQFRALGITYEIGDNTERDFIRVKAKVSADAFVRLLMNEVGPNE